MLQFLTLESCSSSVIAAETAAFPVSLFGIGSLLGDYRNTVHRFIQGINSMMEILACEWIAVLGLMPLNEYFGDVWKLANSGYAANVIHFCFD